MEGRDEQGRWNERERDIVAKHVDMGWLKVEWVRCRLGRDGYYGWVSDG